MVGVSFLKVHKRKHMQRPEVRVCKQEPASWGGGAGEIVVGSESREVNWTRVYRINKSIIKTLASISGKK